MRSKNSFLFGRVFERANTKAGCGIKTQLVITGYGDALRGRAIMLGSFSGRSAWEANYRSI